MRRQVAETWTQMVGFGNILAHGYMDIDRTKVHDTLSTRLPDLEALRRVFFELL